MKKERILLSTFLCAMCSFCSVHAQNLVENGGFETVGPESPTLPNSFGFVDWTDNGDIIVNSAYFAVNPSFPGPHSGAYYLAGGDGVLSDLHQTVNLHVGTDYALKFWLASDGMLPNELYASVAGVTLVDVKNMPLHAYELFTADFTAIQSQSVLRFGLLDPGPIGGLGSLSLDDISITAITDPIIPPLSATPGLTPNQTSIAMNLDGATSMEMANLDEYIAGSDPDNIRAYLDQLSPQKLQVFRNIAVDNFDFLALQMDDHLAGLRNGAEGGLDFSGLQAVDASSSLPIEAIQSRLNRATNHPIDNANTSNTAITLADPKRLMDEPTPVPDRWSAFIAGKVVLSQIYSDQDVPHADFTTGGVTAGADYQLSRNWVCGLLFDYRHTDADLDNFGSKAHVDSYSPGIYAGYANDGWFANGFFAYTRNEDREKRSIPFLGSTATASPKGDQYDTNWDGGYEFKTGHFTYGPTAAMQYVHLGIDSFSETGAGIADLNVNSESIDSLRSRLGGQVRWQGYCFGTAVQPYFSASWQHEYMENSDTITSRFSAPEAQSFGIVTTKEGRESAVVNLGSDLKINQVASLFVDYQMEVGEKSYLSQSVQAGAKFRF